MRRKLDEALRVLCQIMKPRDGKLCWDEAFSWAQRRRPAHGFEPIAACGDQQELVKLEEDRSSTQVGGTCTSWLW